MQIEHIIAIGKNLNRERKTDNQSKCASRDERIMKNVTKWLVKTILLITWDFVDWQWANCSEYRRRRSMQYSRKPLWILNSLYEFFIPVQVVTAITNHMELWYNPIIDNLVPPSPFIKIAILTTFLGTIRIGRRGRRKKI